MPMWTLTLLACCHASLGFGWSSKHSVSSDSVEQIVDATDAEEVLDLAKLLLAMNPSTLGSVSRRSSSLVMDEYAGGQVGKWEPSWKKTSYLEDPAVVAQRKADVAKVREAAEKKRQEEELENKKKEEDMAAAKEAEVKKAAAEKAGAKKAVEANKAKLMKEAKEAEKKAAEATKVADKKAAEEKAAAAKKKAADDKAAAKKKADDEKAAAKKKADDEKAAAAAPAKAPSEKVAVAASVATAAASKAEQPARKPITARVGNFFGRFFGKKKQDFLEFKPYYDKKTMPDNTYKPKSPFEGKIISVERIVGPEATGETCNVVIDHGGKMPYIEGQSYGVIPPGVNPKNGKPNKVRLYSIASSRYGDNMQGKTTTLCVRRATYWCPELKADDPAKKGVCSNYLCDAKAGDVVKLTGPSGKVMLLPEDKPETDIIMVATGTGIAPYRSFLRRMFVEKTPYSSDFKGTAWLFLGVANSDALLYDDEWKSIKANYPDQFRYDIALSREQTNKDGGKMYIQDRVEENADEIFERLEKGAHIYFCGLKGMMPGIQGMLEKVAKSKNLEYEAFIKKLKKNGQWHVEVY